VDLRENVLDIKFLKEANLLRYSSAVDLFIILVYLWTCYFNECWSYDVHDLICKTYKQNWSFQPW